MQKSQIDSSKKICNKIQEKTKNTSWILESHKQVRGHKHRPHHKLGVSFGQSVSDKPNRLQMIHNCMQKFGLKKNKYEQNYNIKPDKI